MSSSERRHCETLLAYHWTRGTSPRGRILLDICYFRYVTTGADSEQPVGALFYQWVGCRDHAGITCFPHSGGWQAQILYM